MINEKQKKLLEDIIEQLEDNKKVAQKKMNCNLDRISEINVSLKTLLDKEEFDTDIFSPRNIEHLYSEQINKYNEERYALDQENRNHYLKINKINNILNDIYNFKSNDKIYKIVPKNNKSEYNSLALLEIDRQRIAKDLHDTSLQNLTAIVHKVELASMYINQDPIRAKLELNIISNSLKETINEIRDTIFELRPMTFDDLGFRELLESYIEKEVENKNINVVIDKYSLNTKDQATLIFTFRVVKECISNSVKHSKCNQINLIIDDSNGENLTIEINDNGHGFDIEEKKLENNKHFGLIIMKERVKLMQGNVDMTSNEEGTKVHITIPLINTQ